jgi:hypothetical protein
MKRSLVWIVLLGVALSLNSCKKDDPAPVNPIVGTWTLAKYKLTDLPQNFTSYEGVETSTLWGYEEGYTLVVNSDNTYSRAYVVDIRLSEPSLYDKGKWALDGTKFSLSPSSPSDLDLIDTFGTVGKDFQVVGDISDIRMTLSATFSIPLLPDDFAGDPTTATNDDYKLVDVTMQLVFNKL